MSADKIRRQMQEIRDKLKPPARPVFGAGIVKNGELHAITITGVEYLRHQDEPLADFQGRVRLAVNAKPLIVFGQPADPSPPFVIA